MRDCAGEIRLHGIIESEAGFFVAEGMEQSGSAGKPLLRRGVARTRKVNRTESCDCVRMLRVIFLGRGDESLPSG